MPELRGTVGQGALFDMLRARKGGSKSPGPSIPRRRPMLSLWTRCRRQATLFTLQRGGPKESRDGRAQNLRGAKNKRRLHPLRRGAIDGIALRGMRREKERELQSASDDGSVHQVRGLSRGGHRDDVQGVRGSKIRKRQTTKNRGEMSELFNLDYERTVRRLARDECLECGRKLKRPQDGALWCRPCEEQIWEAVDDNGLIYRKR